jgi:tripartite-type tricarboxylate transporter receptor subunit TctC
MAIFRTALAAVAIATAATHAAAQQGYPGKPIRMIIPLAAASAVDNAARIVTQKMSANMGQQIVIENIPGAAGLIGTKNVATAAPDGYTLGGFNDSIMTMLPNMHANPGWDILKDFEPISLVATVEWGLVANNESGIRSAADLIARAKAKPGEVNFGSGGNGSPQHVAMALFASQAGVKMTHVPYKGATQAALGIAAGDVPGGLQGIATVAGLARGGKLKLIGVAMQNPNPAFPDVPTISTTGLPGFTFQSWFTIVAPAGTPREIIARLHGEIVKALADPGVQQQLKDQGLTPRGSTPEELGHATREQLARYGRLFREANIKAE